MRSGLLLLSNALLLAGVGCGADPRVKAELATLQGVWLVVNDDGTIDPNTHYEIAGDRMKRVSVDSLGKKIELVPYKLNIKPGHTPTQVDLETPGVDPVRIQRERSYRPRSPVKRFTVVEQYSAAIYKLEGDTLTICMGRGSQNRPTAFDLLSASQGSLVLRRAGAGEGR